MLDVAAALCLALGTGLFLLARRALSALADGSYSAPRGVLLVARADLHVTQSRVGLWLVAAGLTLAAAAAISHAQRRAR
jgi:hypothetical protein